MTENDTPNCPLCQDLQLIRTDTGVRPCECVHRRKTEILIRGAHIPPRYEHVDLENYTSSYGGAHPSLYKAKLFAIEFAKGYPIGTKGQGILFSGGIGTGKTHLAIGIIRELMTQYGVPCGFYDHHALMKEIQATYGSENGPSENAILQPVIDTEVIVLDDLGVMKFSEWTANTISLVLSKRYNDKLTTIITTNYPNLPETPKSEQGKYHEDTLGDRITDRLFSRLTQTCIAVNVHGKDFRQGVGKAQEPS